MQSIHPLSSSQSPLYDLWYLCFSYVVFMFLIPFITLIVMNVRIFNSLEQSKTLRDSCRGGQQYSTMNDNNNHVPLLTALNAGEG